MSESALGEALKVVSKKKRQKKTIRVCDYCKTPLIWTFAFPYAERFCINCGHTGGMLGTGTNVDATSELIFEEKLINAIWKVIYGKKGLMPSGSFGRTNCKKCGSSNNHREHATKAELDGDRIARRWLEKIEGTFNKEPS